MKKLIIPAYYPPATRFLVPWNYQTEDGADRVPLFPSKPDSWVLHSAEGNNSLRWFGDLKKNLRFSHLWFGKKGEIEQYGDLRRISWTQREGNFWGWSAETEGYATEPLTEAQIEALAQWHVWCRASDDRANRPSQHGIGTHSMGGASWGGHACPGPIRSAQRAKIVTRAREIRAEQEAPEMELTDVVYTESNGVQVNVMMCLRSMYRLGLTLSNEDTAEDINVIRKAVTSPTGK